MILAFSCLFASSINVAKAQDVLTATLQHGEEMTAYYGYQAFVNAMNAAVDGDLVTLSAGTFARPYITKAVMIQGAGMLGNRTAVDNALYISLPEGSSGLTLEGVYFPYDVYIRGCANEITFKRCQMKTFDIEPQSTNCSVIQCRIESFEPDDHSKNLLVKNSAIARVGENSDDATLLFENCLITYSGGSRTNWEFNPIATFRNCIIAWPSQHKGCTAYNNVCLGKSFATNSQSNNTLVSDLHILFKDNVFDWNGNLTLTEEAAAQYLGTDGTQVGVFGGAYPYTSIPSNPQITAKEIENQADSNGKLAVKITVEAQ